MTEETEQLELLFECSATSAVNWVVHHGSFANVFNDPYVLTLRLVTDNMDAEPAQMLGQPVKLTLTRGTVMRQITGVVSEVEEGTTAPEVMATTITVVPALEALRHRVNTKIFQEMTVPDILEEVLNEGLGAYDRSLDNRLDRTYPTGEYRVQYHESDLAFCERLMEEEGIVYWFEFEDDTETLVLADASDKYGEVESLHGAILDYSSYEGALGGHEYIREFISESQLTPTKVATRHFDWTHPSVPVEGENSDAVEGDRPNGATLDPEREVYEQDEQPLTLHEYDGATYGANDVDDQTRLRREQQAWEAFVCEGESSVLGMTVGAVFEFVGHPIPEFNGRYLLVGVNHEFDVDEGSYLNHFRCIPETVPFRPRRETPGPRLASVQTATVVGPSGEEIHTDEHGRIKVQFHWDRLGANDENSSCWIRVMQPWAGAGWGFVFIPRIGMEVVVRFIDGDPDRPLVLGSVYNAEHPPPYPLPDEKTKSTIKTESSLGGGGFNEFRFEDQAGSEEIFTHAQKDENEVVENDHTTTVHHDQTNTVDNDQTQEIGNNQTEHIGANQQMTVDANRTTHIKGDFSETVDGSETRTVSSGVNETIDSGETRTISGGMTETITGKRKQTINGSSTETITGALIQTIIGGAKITTPATYDINPDGGAIIIAPAGVTITVPAGHKVQADNGINVISGSQSDSGTNFIDRFTDIMNAKAAKLEIMGICIGHLSYGCEIVGFKTAKVLAVLETTGGLTELGAVRLSKVGPRMKVIASIMKYL